jgi:hypothetical protein
MANAYWQDAVRWDKVYFKALKCKNGEVLEKSKKYIKIAKLTFRLTAFLAALTITSVILGTFFDDKISTTIFGIFLGENVSTNILALVLIILAFLCFTLALIPNFKIPIESSQELIKLEANFKNDDEDN